MHNVPDGVDVVEKIQSRRRKVSEGSVISYLYREGLADKKVKEANIRYERKIC